MSDVDIRRAEPKDAAVLAELGRRTFLETFVEAFAIAYPAHDLDPFLEKKFSETAAAAEIADVKLGVWVAQDRTGDLFGYAVAGPAGLPHPDLSPQDGELYRLYLAKPAQGSGLAHRLMETTLAWLDPARNRRLWLGVWSGNVRAQRFYVRYGFEKAGEYDYRVGASIDHEFIFRRG